MSSLSTRPDALLRDRIAALSPARLKGMRRGVEKESLRALPGGGLIRARGSAAIGQKVFVRDDVIEGSAPSLTLEIIEI